MHFFYITIIILLLGAIFYLVFFQEEKIKYEDTAFYFNGCYFNSYLHALPIIESQNQIVQELKEKNLIKWSEINRKYEINIEGK
jgi:hypothetical protein